MARIDESGTYDVPEKGNKSNVEYLTVLKQLRGALKTNIAEWGVRTSGNAQWVDQRNQQLDVLNDVITTYENLVAAEAAAAAANTAILNANANLSPEQLLQLQLNQQNANAAAQAAAATAQANAAAEKDKANFAAGNTKYYVIAAVVTLVIIVALVLFSKRSKKLAV